MTLSLPETYERIILFALRTYLWRRWTTWSNLVLGKHAHEQKRETKKNQKRNYSGRAFKEVFHYSHNFQSCTIDLKRMES